MLFAIPLHPPPLSLHLERGAREPWNVGKPLPRGCGLCEWGCSKQQKTLTHSIKYYEIFKFHKKTIFLDIKRRNFVKQYF